MLLAMPAMLLANPITEAKAKQQAAQFLAQRMHSGARRAPLKGGTNLTLAGQTKGYYAYNIGRGNGFVMMSASDRTQPILGYADEGQFNLSNAPQPLKQYVQRLSAIVEAAEQGNAQLAPRKSAAESGVATPVSVAKNFVPTLVSCRWNQGSPYNLECPKYTDGNGNQQTAATGCVATAMAQIVYYWKWPKTTTTTMPAYTTHWNNQTVTYPEMAPTSFMWDKMSDVYNGNQSQESQQAVAHLMRALGHGAKMGYGPASGANSGNAAAALRDYFGYDKTSFHTSHDKYTYTEWEDLIYNELAAGRPVLMNGDNSDLTGGHEWVCDGYDGNGLFHMNWGWGGMCDGYFILTVMFPDQQGIGGSTSSDGYSMSQGIVVGLQPNYSGQEQPEQPEVVRNTVTNLRPQQTTLSRTNTNRNFSVLIQYSAGTDMAHAYTFNSGFGLYDAEGNAVKEPIGQETFDLSPGTWWPTRGLTVAFGNGLTDGTYYIRSISRKKGTQDWLHTVNFNTTFIKVVIDGTKAQLTVFPHTDITVQSLTLEGSGTVGVEQKVKATMTNNSETEYYHNTFLLVDGNFVSGNCIQIPALSTRDIYFKYKPETAGKHTLQISTSKNASDAFYTTMVNVKAAVTNNLKVAKPTSLLKVYNVNNKSSIYGNVMKLGVKVTNEGNDTYYSYVEASPWELDGNVYWKRGSYKQTIKLEPGESTTLTFTLPNLNLGSTYNFHIDTDKSNSSNLGNFTFVQGIDYWTADGAANAAPTTGFKVTPDMVAVHVPGKLNVPTIAFEGTPAANATLFFDEGAQINSRVLAILKRNVPNIVMGSDAEQLTLTDGQPFYFPYNFTAKNVTYVRAAERNTTACTTIALPFAPQTVEADGTPLSFVQSADDAVGALAAEEFTSAQGTTVNFTLAPELKPNRPYLLTIKGKTGAASFDQTGKTLTFKATDANIEATESISTYSTNYRLLGLCSATSMSNAYVLSPDGTAFVQQAEATLQPFSAVFVANNDEALQAKTLKVGGLVSTGINTLVHEKAAHANNAIYTLSGQKLMNNRSLSSMPKGIYIIGGRKVVKR